MHHALIQNTETEQRDNVLVLTGQPYLEELWPH
ncbi:MAG: hypothetical protein JWM54_456 [Acidobacteriaceae bacterium]|jgi:hypothetical protein|nr:hypothetical protein [Acidobacteriaceae bacterium]